jgi:hypothetical protein
MPLKRSVPLLTTLTALALAGCVPPAATESPTAKAEAPEAAPPLPTLAPTATSTPVPLASTVFEDAINDPIDCQTGAPIDQPMSGYMDIHSIRVEVNEGGASWVWVVAPGSDLPIVFATNPLAGGLGFADASQPMPEDPDWYFNNVANSGFGFIWNRDTKLLDGYDSIYGQDGWGTIDDFVTAIAVFGNEIRVSLPWEHIPSGSAWYGSTTNGAICDAIGLVEDRPALEGPRAVEGEVTY